MNYQICLVFFFVMIGFVQAMHFPIQRLSPLQFLSSSARSLSTSITTENDQKKKILSNSQEGENLFASTVLIGNEETPLSSMQNIVKKVFTIFRNGFVDFYANFKRVQELKKLLKLHGNDRSVLSFTDYKLMETYEIDFGKAIRTIIFIPFAFEFFLWSSILIPILTMNNNLWAFVNAFPSTFDTPEDRYKRENLLYLRRLSSFYTIALTQYKELSENQYYPAQKINIIKLKENIQLLQIALIQYLQKDNLQQAITTLAPFYTIISNQKNGNGSVKKTNRKKRVELNISSLSPAVIKECCRGIGKDGVPNLPIIRGFNRKELINFVDHLKNSDDFLFEHGLKDLSNSELQFACRERGIGISNKSNEKLRNDLKNYFNALSMENEGFNEQINNQNKRFILFALNTAKDIHDSKPFDILSLVSGSPKK